jgi:hypothetical protein
MNQRRPSATSTNRNSQLDEAIPALIPAARRDRDLPPPAPVPNGRSLHLYPERALVEFRDEIDIWTVENWDVDARALTDEPFHR